MKLISLFVILVVVLLSIASAFASGLRGGRSLDMINDPTTTSMDAFLLDDDADLDDDYLMELALDDENDDASDDDVRRLMTRAEAVAAKKAAIAAKIERVAAAKALRDAAIAAKKQALAERVVQKAEALEKKKAAIAAKLAARAEAVAKKKAAAEAKAAQRAELAAKKKAAAEAKAAQRKAMAERKAAAAKAKAEAAAKKQQQQKEQQQNQNQNHVDKRAPQPTPAPAPAAWQLADQAMLDAMPKECRGAVLEHRAPFAGAAAPLAWQFNAQGGRNRHNLFADRLAPSCCAVSATEATTLPWAAFMEQQGPCAAHAPVTVPCGTKVLVDGRDLDGAIELKGLYVEGELEFVDAPGAAVELRTEFVFNCGELRAGTQDARFESRLDVVLTGFTEVWWRGSKFGRAGFVTYGGETFLRGAHCDKDTWTRLATRAEAGATELTLQLDDLELDTAWKAGDTLMVVASGMAASAAYQTEIVTIAEVGGEDGRSVTIEEPLKWAHAGCEEDGDDEVVEGINCVVAAEVAPLTRNIRIRGEEACKENQMCGHTIFAHTNHGTVCGVEHTNLGQRTTKGRYPLHLHMAGDAPGMVVRSNSIHGTHNRGMVIHAMRKVTFRDNTIYDTLGHNFLFEDGMEEDNKILHNLGVVARGVNWGCKSSHDFSFQCGSRSDGAANAFWINNMNNEFRDNVGVTAGMAFRFEMRHVMGDTRLFFYPEAMKVGKRGKIKHSVRMGKFCGNVAHSSGIGFFSYPMQNPTNGRNAGYENTVVWGCTTGIHVKNTSRGGAMQIVGATLINNVNAVRAHIPASKIWVQQSHLINCPGCAKTLPANMRKHKFIASTEGSIFFDEYSYDYARCRGGWTNPKAQYPRGVLNFLDKDGCDAAPARRFERVPEKF